MRDFSSEIKPWIISKIWTKADLSESPPRGCFLGDERLHQSPLRVLSDILRLLLTSNFKNWREALEGVASCSLNHPPDVGSSRSLIPERTVMEKVSPASGRETITSIYSVRENQRYLFWSQIGRVALLFCFSQSVETWRRRPQTDLTEHWCWDMKINNRTLLLFSSCNSAGNNTLVCITVIWGNSHSQAGGCVISSTTIKLWWDSMSSGIVLIVSYV